MNVYRIERRKWTDRADLLSGKGAAIAGGRWNSKGKAVIYTASSRALAILEVLVHLLPPLTLTDYVLVELTIPEELIEERDPIREIPSNYTDVNSSGPPTPAVSEIEITRWAGDEWLMEKNSAVLKVPSYVVRGEYNYLINPHMSEAIEIGEISENPFDRRLFQNLENLVLEMQELQKRFGSLVRETEDLLKRYRPF